MKNHYLPNISHEFPTPINLMRGPFQTALKKGKLAETQKGNSPMTRNSDNRLLQMANDILNSRNLEVRQGKAYNRAKLLQLLFIQYSAQSESPSYSKSINSEKTIISTPDQEWLEGFENYIKQNYTSEIISVPQMADQFAMSESTLLRQLKRLTGLTPIQYLQEVRLTQAMQLLENQSYQSISEVANAVGYKDTRSFSRGFKKRFSKKPSEVQSAEYQYVN